MNEKVAMGVTFGIITGLVICVILCKRFLLPRSYGAAKSAY